MTIKIWGKGGPLVLSRFFLSRFCHLVKELCWRWGVAAGARVIGFGHY